MEYLRVLHLSLHLSKRHPLQILLTLVLWWGLSLFLVFFETFLWFRHIVSSRLHIVWLLVYLWFNNMGDKLPFHFRAKFQRWLISSHVKLLCCHGNYSAKKASRFEIVTEYERNLSSMILLANQMVYSWNKKIIFPCGLWFAIETNNYSRISLVTVWSLILKTHLKNLQKSLKISKFSHSSFFL